MYTLGRFTTTPLGYSLVHLLEYSLAPRGLQGILRFSGDWVYMVYTYPHAPCVCTRSSLVYFYKMSGVNQKYCQGVAKKSPE